MLEVYNVGDVVTVNINGKVNKNITIIKRWSMNPGGPYTYFEGITQYANVIPEFHISQIIPFKEPAYVPEITGEESECVIRTILDEAKEIITGARAEDYGSAEDSFSDIAAMWNIYLSTDEIKPYDVAAMMILLKMCRNKAKPKRDNWVDTAGYASLGGDLSGQS